VLGGAAVAPLAWPFVPTSAPVVPHVPPWPAPPAPEPGFVAEKYVELPLRPGDEIVAMTVFRDELWAASKYGELFRLRDFER
jgi:hypothetical protein